MKFLVERVFAAMFIFFPALLTAQPVINAVVSGKITDGNTALEGSTVQIKGTTNTATADFNGNFTLKTGQKLPFTLVVSYVGFQKKEVLVSSSHIDIVLDATKGKLDEVVVVGYGTQRKKDVTGSIASVSKEILGRPASSLDNLLQGAVAGVVVNQSSGQPGATATIRIRGGNSLSFGNDPLYVIDGFIYYNDNSLTNLSPNSGTVPSVTGVSSNGLSTINPSDIESIDVLKDAAATAIYGSRGANGVVIITTKRGSKAGNNISYSGSYGVQQAVKSLPVLTGRQWANLFDDLYKATPTIQSGLA